MRSDFEKPDKNSDTLFQIIQFQNIKHKEFKFQFKLTPRSGTDRAIFNLTFELNVIQRVTCTGQINNISKWGNMICRCELYLELLNQSHMFIISKSDPNFRIQNNCTSQIDLKDYYKFERLKFDYLYQKLDIYFFQETNHMIQSSNNIPKQMKNQLNLIQSLFSFDKNYFKKLYSIDQLSIQLLNNHSIQRLLTTLFNRRNVSTKFVSFNQILCKSDNNVSSVHQKQVNQEQNPIAPILTQQ
ncbi:unnamed protein product (macronuclear) [Paramecium tetraurelia]|uniref:Uncharacterized protein n=1 Tax=Paramecium tetraurelia TaxID=5888 RepID=A0EHX7_PARTE|nr:uncharacterized protein GSPATT00027245001 [Paramecium tetraurelia]CAK94918.1 unnamed protein product [Paramecium tetraurelia]|eukprot:XP_001462291.1 hypothetical protein (macronuclear) [Paramecium tetraurelia strain d4-2]